VRPGTVQFVGGQRVGADEVGDRLAAGQPGGLAAQQLADGQRAVGVVVDRSGDLFGQSDEAGGEPPVEAFGALRGWVGGRACRRSG
jgi:hypothetical protein